MSDFEFGVQLEIVFKKLQALEKLQNFVETYIAPKVYSSYVLPCWENVYKQITDFLHNKNVESNNVCFEHKIKNVTIQLLIFKNNPRQIHFTIWCNNMVFKYLLACNENIEIVEQQIMHK